MSSIADVLKRYAGDLATLDRWFVLFAGGRGYKAKVVRKIGVGDFIVLRMLADTFPSSPKRLPLDGLFSGFKFLSVEVVELNKVKILKFTGS